MAEAIQVLVVEDDETTARFIERILEDDGLVVTTAFDGEQALARLEEGIFDIVLLDHMLPDTTGIELLPSIRGRHRRPAVIFLTGAGSEEIAYEALSKGAVDYLVKSDETFATLPETIRRAWDEWGSLDNLARVEHGTGPSGDDTNLSRFLAHTDLEGLVVLDRRGRALLSTMGGDGVPKRLAARAAALCHMVEKMAEATETEDEGEFVLVRGRDRIMVVAGAPGRLSLLGLLPGDTEVPEAIDTVRRVARVVREHLDAPERDEQSP